MSAVSLAKSTLLNALERLEEAERDLGHAVERVDLVVTYEIGGQATDGAWHAALLRRAADAQDEQAHSQDDEDDG